jgi:hypothetical protein
LIIIFSLFTILSHEVELFEADITFSKTFIEPEVLYDLLNNPLDINKADYEDFLSMPYLTPVAFKSIINYRKRKGNFTKIEEVQLVEGVDEQLFNKIRPFLIVRTKPINKKLEIRNRTLKDSFSFNNQSKELSISNRVKLKYGNFDLVFLTDKDALESNLLDFFSFGVSYSTKREQLLVGNYLLGFEQGLVFSKPYYSYVATKTFSGLKTKEFSLLTSALENTSLLGLAYSRNFNNFSFTGFLSSNHLDAELDSNGFVKKIIHTGKHIDSVSLTNKDKLREDLIGTRINYKIGGWILGFSGFHNRYNHFFAPEDSTNSFFGNRLTILGIDGSGVIGNYYWQNEIAYSLGSGYGFSCGLTGDWKPLRISLNLFGTQKNFYSPHSRSYALINKKDNLNGNFNLNYEFYRFRLFFYGSTKTDFVVDSLPAKIETGIESKEGKLNIRISYKRTLKDDISKNQGTKFDLNFDFTRNFNLGFRFEDRQSLTKTGRGILFRLSSNYKYRKLGYVGNIYWFEVTSSDCRVYAYELGLSGLGGNRSFADKGFRYHSFISYRINFINAGLKIGLTKLAQVIFDLGSQIEVHL